MLMERSGMDRRTPIGTMTDSRGSKWSVYDVRRDEAGEVTQAYVEFGERADGVGLSMKDWGLQSPHWTTAIHPGCTLMLTHRIEFRVYRHEHPDFFDCTDCPYDVVSSEFGPWQKQAEDWLASKGWPVGDFTTKYLNEYSGGGVRLWRFEIPTEEAPEWDRERRVKLTWL